MESIKEKILEEYKKGNLVIRNFQGLSVYKVSDFVKQPVEGILYDLNRNESVILTFLPDEKWINDYASTQVIRQLKSIIEELENKINDSKL